MANPTTNYGFILPTSTDLVTDLPADFDVALQGVDTQMLTNANAAIAKAIVDAKGDIIAATAADTVSRLAIGANNTVLTADSAEATGMKWASAASGSGPTFSAQSNTEQNISASTYTKVTLQVENWDSAAAFASNRFTPLTAGYYQVNAVISFACGGSTTSRAEIYKNGSSYSPGNSSLGPAIANPNMVISTLVDLNGTTDFIELFGFNDASSGTRQFYRGFFNATFIRSL